VNKMNLYVLMIFSLDETPELFVSFNFLFDRLQLVVNQVDVSTLAQQEFYEIFVFQVDRVVQRRSSILVLRINVAAVVQKIL